MFEIVIERFFPPAPGGRGYSSQRVGATCETEAEAKIKVASLKNEHTGDYYISYRKAKEVKEENVSNKITAAEARKLAGPTVQERVDEVYAKIREAATEGKRYINLHDWWATEGYSGIDEYKQACMILEGDGFKVEFVYEERQFVNMYTSVEW
jgi:hypothetical protein